MISESAKRGFSAILANSLLESLPVVTDRSAWNIRPVNDLRDIKEKEVMMLVVSAFTFRTCVFLHFTRTPEMMSHIAKTVDVSVDQYSKQACYDYISELSNGFCGALKRELGRHFKNLGISTPNKLQEASLNYVNELKYDFDTHVKAIHNNQEYFSASLLVCAYAKLDFVTKHSSNSDEVEPGELELF